MLEIINKLKNKHVAITYIPSPYLGRGIVEPKTVYGILQPIRTALGGHYVSLHDEHGMVIFEKNLCGIESIEESHGGHHEDHENEHDHTSVSQYSRVSK